mmetsp:Transcript_11172/g.41718  ORF Transcript_11172/g.41718 Transcript_11172/m.41718 type:complete len:238 (-) Transcript_11172:119-832(-)
MVCSGTQPSMASLMPVASSSMRGTKMPGVSTMYMSGLVPTQKSCARRVTPAESPMAATCLFQVPEPAWAAPRKAFKIVDLPTLGMPHTMIMVPPVTNLGAACTFAQSRIFFPVNLAFLALVVKTKSFSPGLCAGVWPGPAAMPSSSLRMALYAWCRGLVAARSALFSSSSRGLVGANSFRSGFAVESGALASRTSTTKSQVRMTSFMRLRPPAMWPGNQWTMDFPAISQRVKSAKTR